MPNPWSVALILFAIFLQLLKVKLIFRNVILTWIALTLPWPSKSHLKFHSSHCCLDGVQGCSYPFCSHLKKLKFTAVFLFRNGSKLWLESISTLLGGQILEQDSFWEVVGIPPNLPVFKRHLDNVFNKFSFRLVLKWSGSWTRWFPGFQGKQGELLEMHQ